MPCYGDMSLLHLGCDERQEWQLHKLRFDSINITIDVNDPVTECCLVNSLTTNKSIVLISQIRRELTTRPLWCNYSYRVVPTALIIDPRPNARSHSGLQEGVF